MGEVKVVMAARAWGGLSQVPYVALVTVLVAVPMVRLPVAVPWIYTDITIYEYILYTHYKGSQM